MVSDRFDVESLSGDDPRLSPRFVRVVDTGGDYPVIVVGVVHDHPSSVFRATSVADAVEPGVVALELPNALVGLFESHAAADDSVGGEMAAAIAAAPDADVVGIDAPSVGATRVLAAELADRDLSVRSVARTIREFCRLGVETVRGRLSVAGVPDPWLGDVPGTSQEFDLTDAETPAAWRATRPPTSDGARRCSGGSKCRRPAGCSTRPASGTWRRGSARSVLTPWSSRWSASVTSTRSRTRWQPPD
ncbi:hypothetical protein [Halobacterium bonnevillei]|uniref:Uncharacterized protein n=1 Tax=Halobacterium bonnevillei TaxID=2692200 RepID=A0A6B0SF58_9EURY|nr:hypothetical protein [Halobacterium bonnevillei]MXR20355.1 hypothetical protein [Halobacterium bonnevillei]